MNSGPESTLPEPAPYVLPDMRVGHPEAPDPLERYSWPELRSLIYGDF